MEKRKQNWFEMILGLNKPLRSIGKVKTTSTNKLNLTGTISIFMILLLSVTLVYAGNVTMQAGNLDINDDLIVDTNTLKIDSVNDKVGIGTTFPTQKLSVIGNVNVTGNISTSQMISVGNVGTDTYYSGGTIKAKILRLGDTSATHWIYGSNIYLGNAPSNGLGHQFTAASGNSNAYLASGGGKVGIGTTSPTEVLNVIGNANITGNITTAKDVKISGYYYGDASRLSNISSEGIDYTNLAMTNKSNTFGAFDQVFDTNTLKIDSTNDRVGIGTISPGKKLDVVGDIRLRGDYATINFYRDTSPTDIAYLKYNQTENSLVMAANNKDLRFINQLNWVESMRIKNDGNVGIRTINPTMELDVNGNVTANDFILKSKTYTGDALNIIKDIKNDESLSETGDWRTVDHSTLGGAEIIFDYTVPVYEEKDGELVFIRDETRTFKGQSIDKTIALLIKANQQLLARVEALEAKQ